MLNSRDEIGDLEIATNTDEIEKLATKIVFQTLVVSALRILLAVLIAHWLRKGTRLSQHGPVSTTPAPGK